VARAAACLAALAPLLLLGGMSRRQDPPRLPATGQADFSMTALIRTTQGGVIVSRSAQSGPWACGGKAWFVRNGVLGFDTGCIAVVAGRMPVADGQWRRVGVAYSHAASTATFYIDGRLDAQVSLGSNPDVEGDILRLGAAAQGLAGPNGFVGDLDEVALYSRALSPEEMARTDLPQPDALWTLDGSGADVSGKHALQVRGGTFVPGMRGRALHCDGATEAADIDPLDEARARFALVNLGAARLAVADMRKEFGARLPGGDAMAARLAEAERSARSVAARLARGDADLLPEIERLLALQRSALLANPLLDCDKLLLVRRGAGNLGLVQNWESNSSLPRSGFDNEVAILTGLRGEPKLTTLYKPDGGRFVGDLDLHWDARRLLFSMPGEDGRWQVFEKRLDGTPAAQLGLIDQPLVDNYDACYLPDGDVLFTSTAPFVGVPCVTGASHVSNIYRTEKGRIRRLTFEQDHDWCPTVMADGRILYLRWEYTDIPHFASRILFTMNPDGTQQAAHYGSNSYWPNALFYARTIPGNATQFAAIVGGHHDVPRMGELTLFDTALGRHEAAGAVQRIPGRGKSVVPIIRDELVAPSWPKFLHPWPLSARYFLVAAKPTPASSWGIYLADVFDNLTLIAEAPGSALLEPIPVERRPVPPAIPARTRPGAAEADVSITDIYRGPGLAGVPRGTVTQLRLFSYQFAYHGMGGQINRVGLDGPWDVKRILGTVPVAPDGSAHFTVPANTPISMQPLDAEGKALQLMRSWMTAMPGERVHCTGCHEPQNAAGINRPAGRAYQAPDKIRPWYGPARGFSFRREVQPVLDRYCVSCHDGRPGTSAPNLADAPDVSAPGSDAGYRGGSHFPPSYLALRSHVRGHTIESDLHLLTPGEFHADTTRLVRMLQGGHAGVRLSREAWDRIITWIDLNTPAHGSWREIVGDGKVNAQRALRRRMDALYAGADLDPEADADLPRAILDRNSAASALAAPSRASAPLRRPTAMAARPVRVSAGPGLVLDMVRLTPAGGRGAFLIGACEVTNAQYAAFDPRHDSRLETGDFLQFAERERGYPVNGPAQPVCRVSWDEAQAFCRRISTRTGKRWRLPTRSEWEAACLAGARTPLAWGASDADFGRLANLADATLGRVDTFGWGLPSGAISPYRRVAAAVDDGHRVTAPVRSYRPNAWGLYDMHGNVAEWLQEALPGPGGGRLVTGGSWSDLPEEARIGATRRHPRWQRVFDVGFRVVCENP
jgi:hypothetical protein